MLGSSMRMRKADDFRFAFRCGVSAGGRYVVSHMAQADDEQILVGFVVSKKVGNSVVRHRVKRQCRHIVRERLMELPKGARLVVRALPSAAGQSSDRLTTDIYGTIERTLRKLTRRTQREEKQCKSDG
ncbi:MAG: ribonuclease P protein component [Bowdeniella nasicola]|nr:ribonuclease P protein component [Bowdeniella nasicola]